MTWLQDRIVELIAAVERIAAALEKLAETVGDGVLYVKGAND